MAREGRQLQRDAASGRSDRCRSDARRRPGDGAVRGRTRPHASPDRQATQDREQHQGAPHEAHEEAPMTNDWDTQGLELVANDLKQDATFLSGWLPDEPNGRDILRDHIAIDAADWNRLLLCRPPSPSTFWDDVRKIAEYVHADPLGLA